MVRRAWPVGFLLLVLAGGCPLTESSLPLVPDGPLVTPITAETLKAFHAPATEAVGLRVHQIGQHVLASNADLPVRPAFRAVGTPQPELFHTDTSAVYVSEGLVNRCANDAQVAALLSVELGRMMSQREALAALKARRPDRDPPAGMPVGGDSGGVFGSADAVRLAELAKYDDSRRAVTSPPPPPPDPQALGRMYFTKAGYKAAELDAVAPLLREVEKNGTLEKQINGGTPVRAWVP
jgi:hypothetical protein